MTFDRKGMAKCSIEKAQEEEGAFFGKLVSCHLSFDFLLS